MAVEITDVSDGVISLKVTGTVTEEDRSKAHQETADIIRDQGQVRIFIDATDLKNWGMGLTWDDDAFKRNDAFIEKMAFVGDRKWEDVILIFANKDFREFPIEYFDATQLAEARAWLAA